MATQDARVLRVLLKLRKALHYVGLSNLSLVKRMALSIKQHHFSQIFDGSLEHVSAKVDGLQMSLPRRFLHHYIFQEYERLTKKTFQRSLRPGMVVIDVGAHIGFYTLIAARAVGETGTVHAIEPCSENLASLAKNISLNGFKSIRVHPYAGGKSRGSRTFHITGSSDSHGFYSHPLANTVKTVEILEMPLDEVIDAPVHAVKIDVEGAEMEVLQGMRHLLTESHPPLWVEWNPACMRRGGYQPLDLPSYLSDLGYRDILVLNDRENCICALDAVLEFGRTEKVPDYWYVNLWARRG